MKLVIVVDVDLDPTLEDPHDVADNVLAEKHYDMPQRFDFVAAEWVDAKVSVVIARGSTVDIQSFDSLFRQERG